MSVNHKRIFEKPSILPFFSESSLAQLILTKLEIKLATLATIIRYVHGLISAIFALNVNSDHF